MTNKAKHHERDVDLQYIMTTLWRHKLPIGSALVIGAILGGLYANSLTPVYRADALLEIKPDQRNQILSDLNNMAGGGGMPSATESEIDLIKSRAVVGQTVDNLRLDTTITPKTSFFDTLFSKAVGESAPVVSIRALTVPEDWENKPITLTVLNNTNYKLTLPDGKAVDGKVGSNLQPAENMSIMVDQLMAPGGTEFEVTKQSKLSAIQQVNENLMVSDKGRNSPLLSLNYTGTNPKLIQNVLNQVITNYVSMNKNRDIQMASSGLGFIHEELPKVRQALQDAESRLNAFRVHSGSVDVPTEARTAVENLSTIETQITTLKAEEAGMSQLYTNEHPDYKTLKDRLAVLEQSRDEINHQIAALPNTQQEVIRLTRDVETNQATYVQLLAKQQEFNIIKASSQGNVRVIDNAATGENPVRPQKPIMVLLAALAAGLMTSAWYIFKALSRPTLKSAEEVTDLGYNLISGIPVSVSQSTEDARFKRMRNHKTDRPNYLLAANNPNDIAIETLRALRTTLHFSTIDKKCGVIMITGTTPSVGKSFLSSNLAAVTAQADQKVLLIDADMRRGTLHDAFNLSAENGLSELLAGTSKLSACVKKTEISGLDLISRGHSPQAPSELLMSQDFVKLIESAREQYDQIIIDTAPALAVTDSSIIGRLADISLLVTRYNHTTDNELHDSYARLQSSGVKIKGVLFNGIEKNARNYYQYKTYTQQ